MTDLKLYNAFVISNDDPERKGRVQIRILPEMTDVEDIDLPWVVPFVSQSSSTTQEKDVFPIGSNLWVLVDPL